MSRALVSQAPSTYEAAPSSTSTSTSNGSGASASTSAHSGIRHAPEHGAKGEHAGDLMKQVIQGQTDAPPCSECGSLMIRAGACYKCPDCGTTSGCG